MGSSSLLRSSWASRAARVLFAEDVDLVSVTLPREVAPGGTATLTFRFRPHHATAADERLFVHAERAQEPSGRHPCRAVVDADPTPPSTQWSDAEIIEDARLVVPTSCLSGPLVIYAGLYDPKSTARLHVVEPSEAEDRVVIGSLEVVSSDADSSSITLTASDVHAEALWSLLRPWWPWLAGLGLASALSATFALRRAPAPERPVETTGTTAGPRSPWDWLPFALPAIAFMLGILAVLEFVKDDAYISFRYAHNLVTGHGLVFNMGERLEGYTNFLWVLVLAPFEALGWDLFQVCEVLGSVLGLTCLALTVRMTSWVHGPSAAGSELWGAFWLSTSSSFVLWAKAGLEQPLSTLLPIAGAFVLWRARERLASAADPASERRAEKRYLAAGLIMGAGCMTRPELHLLAVLVGGPLVVDVARARKVRRAEWLYVAGILAVTVPCHAFRFAYYGTLIPNTFYVKTGTGAGVWRQGLQTLREMFAFNFTGLLAVAAPLAFIDRRHRVEKITMAVISLAFMLFYVKVGVDEMQWHRLYLPALPFLCVLAAIGAEDLIDRVLRALGRAGESDSARVVAYGLGWTAVSLASWNNFGFTYREQNGFNGHGDLAGTFHPDLGKFLVRHERPGALVAFQDMGSTPYHAPDINFLDFFGLVDRTVAHARHDAGLHAFVAGGSQEAQRAYDAQMRDYFFGRNPEWAILTIYTPGGEERRLADVFGRDPTGGSFGSAYRDNNYQFALWDDPRFRERYVPVRTWPRSAAYYLALWRRRDLWEQTPREVVLDAAPPNIGGPRATFEGGLELLGADVTPRTLERHEVFITTWWKVPGPMPPDVFFFVHVTKPGFQTPADHVPGDWMYPADRWKPGEIIEDRTLFQLPPLVMGPGTYRVYMGAYRRSTGERFKIVAGPSDGDNRIALGSFEAGRLYPLIEQLIPPTRTDVMRKYPDRIVDSLRR